MYFISRKLDFKVCAATNWNTSNQPTNKTRPLHDNAYMHPALSDDE